jgi:hypothetical protein
MHGAAKVAKMNMAEIPFKTFDGGRREREGRYLLDILFVRFIALYDSEREI